MVDRVIGPVPVISFPGIAIVSLLPEERIEGERAFTVRRGPGILLLVGERVEIHVDEESEHSLRQATQHHLGFGEELGPPIEVIWDF